MIHVDDEGRVISFVEKAENPPEIPGRPGWSLASMGNYIFKREALQAELIRDQTVEESAHDFGKSVLPSMVEGGRRVFMYDFATNVVPGEDKQGYWRDIGTISTYFEAHMDLVSVSPEFNLYNRLWPIRTGVSFDPPAKFVFSDQQNARIGIATDSLVSDGCIISGGQIHKSVLSPGVRVNSFCPHRAMRADGTGEGRSVRSVEAGHRRQRRRASERRPDWVRCGGGQEAVHGHRRRHRRDSETRAARGVVEIFTIVEPAHRPAGAKSKDDEETLPSIDARRACLHAAAPSAVTASA